MADIHNKEIDQVSGVETTGHEWDGLKELNNPLPKWWLYLFYVTIVWAVIYWVLYPSWPLISSYTTGILGANQRAEAIAAYEEVIAGRSEFADKVVATPLEDIGKDQQLLQFALANGQAAFGDNCAPCHGGGGAGSEGYPNLQDDTWIWGGTLEDIHTSLQYGIRSDHDEARFGEMPAFGRDELLTGEEIDQVANFVASRVGLTAEEGVDLAAGQTLYADNCAACHGESLEGIQEVGAPSLMSANYLYGKSLADIKAQIDTPRNGVMPAWAGRLDPATIKSLTLYVHSFGGGI
ncbi:cytochrome-c oxidase, cbb3-type subunit III [Roseibium salinum]|uniref:Cbb3-type cytochrome c oxidase subunit n=1 Tax=Roseibium salinum TaxID=1604349 RepID=A0ABT3R372_9HYPH|nr:cytochrome-c oxidase, cbb3-type subunit III [Roseibium sp. DSM 29163]MCX2723602.1 cytochrome-c oxidase, cbb3-type subunit III [Roseibium sp. DSM 29163]MDN3718534.1 cytochrome-c oxidase, cbb3-type subunit III [Roseibium salinum]